MSLRIRLNLIVSMLFLGGMVLGLAFLIGNARQRVASEVLSEAELTYELLNSVLLDTTVGQDHRDHRQLLEHLQGINNARDLDIFLSQSGHAPEHKKILPESSDTPQWFTYLVSSPPLEYRVALDPMDTETIVIRTNGAAEINEVWSDTSNFIAVLLLVLLILNGFLYFTIGRWLAPVQAIVVGLNEVEQGDFSGHFHQAYLPELQLITEKLNQLTRVLRESKKENDRLALRSLVIQEEERRRLAHELHDELGQSISAIKAIAFSIATRTEGIDTMITDGASRIGQISNHVSAHVRSIMSRLRPALLDELGLVPALQVMVDEWNNHHREIFCSFRTQGDFSGLDGNQQISLYRIVQEALTNVAKHANADRVDVILTCDDVYMLRIADNGTGYEPSRIQQGMGLLGMRERSQALGGALNLVTEAGAGLKIELVFSGDRAQ